MTALLLTEYIGIASAALSGYLYGVKKECDLLGIFLASFLTALGGGMVRDILVGRDLYSFTHYMPVSIVLFVIIISWIFKIQTKRESLDKSIAFVITDAIDVVSFSIVGAMVALDYGFNIFGVLIIALANGVGGGILRDILYNEIPWFMKTGFYGTVSIVVGFIYFLMHNMGFTSMFWIMVLFIFGVIFRMIAYKKNWRLPKFEERS
ncbi:trimeric intracellular cation channel family protein [Campylobacter sp. FMV-PI01]|uniref:Trimeric intracellular cation channel family protein n=1 Tax=Campylobacter portucalensis TaxID=2608384 RepID=A0A6L5WIW5_9BACT|nr:TRIC cation channel family protein [Campylobacter portucalensis]MSN97099.1 trimeric intracellular cation channel family protein [Campylobacter portucalensis]